MRALFISQPELADEKVLIEGPRHHHLVQVTRAKVGDEILLLDGRGLKACSKVTEIKKKALELEILTSEIRPNDHFLSAFIGCPKKEAVEEILRRAVELGLREIIFYKSEFSPWMYEAQPRFEKIIESALIQSNNFWAPEIKTCSTLESALRELERFQHGVLFDLNHSDAPAQTPVDLLCIGPEAGWSAHELAAFSALAKVERVRLKAPIMRAEHALSVAAGYALAKA